MKLTAEQLNRFNQKMIDFMNPPFTSLGLMLLVDPIELHMIAYGGEGSEEVVQAVREWIA